MIVIGVDPGSVKTGIVVTDGLEPVDFFTERGNGVLSHKDERSAYDVAITAPTYLALQKAEAHIPSALATNHQPQRGTKS